MRLEQLEALLAPLPSVLRGPRRRRPARLARKRAC